MNPVMRCRTVPYDDNNDDDIYVLDGYLTMAPDCRDDWVELLSTQATVGYPEVLA